jgi:phage-related protein (TIGR01555 family)
MLQFLGDRLQNLISGLGTDKDKATRSAYVLTFLTPEELIYAYRGDWIARKVVDVPAFDMVRAGRNWQAEDDQIERIEAQERRLQIRAKLLKALKWARLFGGSAMVLGVRQGLPEEELNLEAVGTGALQFVHVVGANELTAGDLDRDPLSAFFGEPTYYEMRSASGAQVRIHPSRVIRFIGAEAPEFQGGVMSGWGDSVLLAVDDALRNAGLAASGIASLVTEAKIDVFKIKGLTQNVTQADYRTKMLARFGLANQAKSLQNALIMDSEEEWEQKQISFAQLPELLQTYLQVAAGAADIPATRLLGQSPAGMNATGESDIRNYYDRLSGEQEMHLRPALEKLDEVMIRSALGRRPPEAYFTFAPLWQLSEKERAEVFKTKAEAARTIAGTGGASPALMPIEALSDSLVNALVEDGSLPGLDQAIDEYGKLSEQEPEEAETQAAMTPEPAPAPMRQAANDATPRTLYVSRKLLNGAEFLAWAKAQGFETTVPADELHVTIAYSRTPVDWLKMGEDWRNEANGGLVVGPGGARLVEPLGDAGAVVLMFTSSALSWRHREMREAGASWDHEDYQPHVTITYQGAGVDLAKVEPYRGKLAFGPEIFAEVDDGWSSRLTENSA